ncbi:hypothetical protein D8878_11675 [Streptococcus sanguinis]|nr:hypothetical protein D8878_11675 [Streptococcus sanguinis]
MFGLIYFSIFEEKKLNDSKINNLRIKLNNKIEELKEFKIQPSDLYPEGYDVGYYHQKNPNALKYIRIRLRESLELYKEYFSE